MAALRSVEGIQHEYANCPYCTCIDNVCNRSHGWVLPTRSLQTEFSHSLTKRKFIQRANLFKFIQIYSYFFCLFFSSFSSLSHIKSSLIKHALWCCIRISYILCKQLTLMHMLLRNVNIHIQQAYSSHMQIQPSNKTLAFKKPFQQWFPARSWIVILE